MTTGDKKPRLMPRIGRAALDEPEAARAEDTTRRILLEGGALGEGYRVVRVTGKGCGCGGGVRVRVYLEARSVDAMGAVSWREEEGAGDVTRLRLLGAVSNLVPNDQAEDELRARVGEEAIEG